MVCFVAAKEKNLYNKCSEHVAPKIDGKRLDISHIPRIPVMTQEYSVDVDHVIHVL